jgi:hypothetical protein
MLVDFLGTDLSKINNELENFKLFTTRELPLLPKTSKNIGLVKTLMFLNYVKLLENVTN